MNILLFFFQLAEMENSILVDNIALIPLISHNWRTEKETRDIPDFISFFFWSFGITDYNTFSIQNSVPLNPVLGAVKDVALFIISHEQTQ